MLRSPADRPSAVWQVWIKAQRRDVVVRPVTTQDRSGPNLDANRAFDAVP
jgi:hypothetical protein